MTAPIALQLYTLRESAAQDYAAMVRQVADMGFVGVETAGFPGTTAQAAARLFKELGLEVCAAHSPMPLGERQNEAIDNVLALGTKRLIVAGTGAENFTSVDGIHRRADEFNAAYEVAQTHGLQFGLHNHWWEFGHVDGRLAFDILLERLDPAIFWEIDTYWAKVAGTDPVPLVKRLGQRAPLLHIKDGPGVREEPHVALGQGMMDIAGILEAAAPNIEWAVVELDRCATDMTQAVRESYAYLVGKGLAQGRK